MGILVVAQQKGGDSVECKQRIRSAERHYLTLRDQARQDLFFGVIGGANGGTSPETVRLWLSKNTRNNVIIDNSAGNTHEKADAIARFCLRDQVSEIHQFTSAYHSLRAHLTTHKSLKHYGLEVKLLSFMSDLKNSELIRHVIIDEILLASGLMNKKHLLSESTLRFKISKPQPWNHISAGVRAYHYHKKEEAERLVRYGENGTKHLSGDINIEAIFASYPQIINT